MHALVRADGDRPRDACERVVAVGRERLLDQRDAGLCASGKVCCEIVRRPAFIGVDDELGPRARRVAPRQCARGRPAAPSLTLSSARSAACGGGLRHRIRRCKRDRIGGGDGPWRGEAEKLVHRPSGALGRQIPERAVERVARRARRHGGLQALAIKPAGNVRGHRLDRRRHALDRLAVARIGHALAPAAMGAVGEFRDHDDGFGLGAAADGKRAGDRPALHTNGQGEGAHRRRMHEQLCSVSLYPGRRALAILGASSISSALVLHQQKGSRGDGVGRYSLQSANSSAPSCGGGVGR